MFIYWVVNSVVCNFGFGLLGPPYITGIQICIDCAVFVNSHVGQCFTASAFFVYRVCAFVCMVATRWKSVVYLFFPCRSSKALKSRETFCSTVSRNRAALLGNVVLFFLHVHSLVVHACQTRLSVHTRIYFIQRLWKGYRAVTIHRPRATLAASRALPASSRKKPISSRFCRSVTTVTSVASSRAFNIHWPSRAKHGTEFTTANAPERETTYLRGRRLKRILITHITHTHTHFTDHPSS